jgi:hypothetical protein
MGKVLGKQVQLFVDDFSIERMEPPRPFVILLPARGPASPSTVTTISTIIRRMEANMTFHSVIRQSRITLALPFLAVGVALGAESYTARAELKTADGKLRTAPVTVSLDRMLTTAERDTLLAAFKSGDAAALRRALAAQTSLGYVEGGKVKVPIKFAFPRSTGAGKVVTIVCDEPIVHIGGDVPDAKSKAGFDFAFVLLVLDAEGTGTGEIAPAAKLKLREDGALVTEDYGAETVWLMDVARK